jgi:hypothetical protein
MGRSLVDTSSNEPRAAGEHVYPTVSLSTTACTPGADQAAPRTAERSAIESTLPVSVTVAPRCSTQNLLAGIGAFQRVSMLGGH